MTLQERINQLLPNLASGAYTIKWRDGTIYTCAKTTKCRKSSPIYIFLNSEGETHVTFYDDLKKYAVTVEKVDLSEFISKLNFSELRNNNIIK